MPDRSIAPVAGKMEKISFPPLSTGIINNVPLLEIENTNHDIFYLECVFDSGRIRENLPGISWYAAKMLLEGTLHYQAHELAEKIEGLGSYIDISAGNDQVSIRLYSLSKNIKESVDLLIEILHNPSFPEAEFSLLKNIRCQNLENILAKNSQFASLLFTEKLFGQDHPYGRIMLPEHAQEIELDDVKKYYSSTLFQNPKLIIGGNFHPSVADHVIQAINQVSEMPLVEEWHEPSIKEPGNGSFVTKKENGAQASLRIGSRCMDRYDEAIHDFSIANTLLGGFFGSRLMKSVREEKGLSYGIYSSLVHNQYASYTVISAEVQSDRKAEAEEAILLEIEKLSNHTPSLEELNLLKNYLYGKMQSSMDSLFSIINLQKDLFLYGLDNKFLEAYLDRLANITSERISELVKKEFLDKSAVTITVN